MTVASRILMLHSVLPDYDPENYYFRRHTAISWARFTALLDAIEAAGWRTATLDELQSDARSGGMRRQHQDTVFITFDDGYQDTLAACRELRRRGMSATVFPVRDFVRDGFSPIDDMAAHLSAGRKVDPALSASLLDGRLKRVLRGLGVERYRYLRARWFGIDHDAPGCFIPEAQLRDLLDDGIAIGAHGTTHRSFTTLTNTTIHHEVSAAIRWLEDLGCRGRLALSFPHGQHDHRVVTSLPARIGPLLTVDREPACRSVYRRLWVTEQPGPLT